MKWITLVLTLFVYSFEMRAQDCSMRISHSLTIQRDLERIKEITARFLQDREFSEIYYSNILGNSNNEILNRLTQFHQMYNQRFFNGDSYLLWDLTRTIARLVSNDSGGPYSVTHFLLTKQIKADVDTLLGTSDDEFRKIYSSHLLNVSYSVFLTNLRNYLQKKRLFWNDHLYENLLHILEKIVSVEEKMTPATGLGFFGTI